MAPADLTHVERVAATVHPDLPEDADVLAERLALYPAGCFVLDQGGAVHGYVLGHPWLSGRPPALNTRLGRLPAEADTFYVHDLAILTSRRGGGAGRRAVELLAHQARRDGFATMSLVAVGASPAFWRSVGFSAAETPSAGSVLTSYKGAVLMTRPLCRSGPA